MKTCIIFFMGEQKKTQFLPKSSLSDFENVIFLLYMFCHRRLEVVSLVLARRRRKIFERTLDFLHSPPQAKIIFFWGGRGITNQYIHNLYSAEGENRVKIVSYIHIFYTIRRRWKQYGFFSGSKWFHIYTFFPKPAADGKIRVFLGTK